MAHTNVAWRGVALITCSLTALTLRPMPTATMAPCSCSGSRPARTDAGATSGNNAHLQALASSYRLGKLGGLFWSAIMSLMTIVYLIAGLVLLVAGVASAGFLVLLVALAGPVLAWAGKAGSL